MREPINIGNARRLLRESRVATHNRSVIRISQWDWEVLESRDGCCAVYVWQVEMGYDPSSAPPEEGGCGCRCHLPILNFRIADQTEPFGQLTLEVEEFGPVVLRLLP